MFINSFQVMNINERIRMLCQKSELLLQNFNLFQSIPPSTDEFQLRNQRISTRLFIFLLTLSMSILLLYTSLVTITQTVSVKTPTITQYSQLYSKYPQTLTCHCTKISINYDKILHVQYTFHQVCNSVFVSKYWTDYLSTSKGDYIVFFDDFRGTGTFTFQALNTFCELINQTISNRLTQFYSNQYVSESVVSSEIFQSQIQSLISQFRLSTTNDFLLSLSTVRDTTQSNALMSGILTNYELYTKTGSVYIFEYPQTYGNCDCTSSAMCAYQSLLYGKYKKTILFAVPGIYIGCYIIESLLQSDLHCFYNQTCIDQLQSFLFSYSPINATALDKSLSSRFLENSTIQELVDQLMIEQWNSTIMYDSYYNECQPSECIYTHQTKNSIVYIVMTIVGLIGGLTTAFKLIIPRMVSFIAFCIRKCRVRRGAVMPIIQT